MKHSLKKLGCAVLSLAMALTLLPAAALAADETAESGFAAFTTKPLTPSDHGNTMDSIFDSQE